jgi:hypothetical protein
MYRINNIDVGMMGEQQLHTSGVPVGRRSMQRAFSSLSKTTAFTDCSSISVYIVAGSFHLPFEHGSRRHDGRAVTSNRRHARGMLLHTTASLHPK